MPKVPIVTQPVILDGQHLTIHDLERVARHGAPVELAPEAEARITRCREFVERQIASGRVMYGINTGIGELSEVVLSPDQIRSFQR